MSKVVFEFDGAEESYDVSLCTNRTKMAVMLQAVQDYARQLRKYEQRENIPTEEVEKKLTEIIYDWYIIQDV